MLRAYIAHPSSWSDVIHDVKANLDQLNEPTRRLYQTSTHKQLRDRLSTKLSVLMAKDLENIENQQLRHLAGQIRSLERRLVDQRQLNVAQRQPGDLASVAPVLQQNQARVDDVPPVAGPAVVQNRQLIQARADDVVPVAGPAAAPIRQNNQARAHDVAPGAGPAAAPIRQNNQARADDVVPVAGPVAAPIRQNNPARAHDVAPVAGPAMDPVHQQNQARNRIGGQRIDIRDQAAAQLSDSSDEDQDDNIGKYQQIILRTPLLSVLRWPLSKIDCV